MGEQERVRLEIAFQGGQALTVWVTNQVWDDLGRALASGATESLAFDAEDGSYTVSVRRIVFVKRYSRESRVGFGTVS